jgi:hypothetical protein
MVQFEQEFMGFTPALRFLLLLAMILADVTAMVEQLSLTIMKMSL